MDNEPQPNQSIIRSFSQYICNGNYTTMYIRYMGESQNLSIMVSAILFVYPSCFNFDPHWWCLESPIGIFEWNKNQSILGEKILPSSYPVLSHLTDMITLKPL